MSQYDVYSVGSAIVDLQFTVPFDMLHSLSGDKGAVYIIDNDMEKKLRTLLQQQEPQRSCGGSGANTLVAVQHLGGKTFYSCKVANDFEGDFYHRSLLQHNISSNLDLQSKSAGITGKSIILVTPDADRTLYTFLGASGTVSDAELHEPSLSAAQYLFIEGFLLFSPFSKQIIGKAYQMARNHKVKIALTLSTCLCTRELKKELLAMIYAGVDILFCNELEAKIFCGTDDLTKITAELSRISKQFVLTRGEKGALLYNGASYYDIASYPAEVVDTTGAGDAFAGAFLYACCRDYDFPAAGNLASKIASKVVCKFGARL